MIDITIQAKKILDDFCDLEKVTAFMELDTGMDSNWGQTVIALNTDDCFVVTRNSYSEPFRKCQIDRTKPMEIRVQKYEDALIMTTVDGHIHTFQLYPRALARARIFANAFLNAFANPA